MTDPATADVRRHVLACVRATLHGDAEAWAALQPVDDFPVFAGEAITLLASVVDHSYHDPDRALAALAAQLAPIDAKEQP